MKHLVITSLLCLLACNKDNDARPGSRLIAFSEPQPVTVLDYNEDVMEPFLSREGTVLFFNNLNSPAVNTNLHFASKINDSTFQYQGELKGVNTPALEGVATMDEANRLYFVSTRSYEQTLSSIYIGDFEGDSVAHVELVPNISKNIAGWLNFDVEVSPDGSMLFYVDGRFDQNGGPYEADIVHAEKINGTFQRSTDQSMVANLNTDDLEYAVGISPDELELYFTRVEVPLTETSEPQLYVATRNSLDETFATPYKIDEITGFVEAPTISPDGQTIYFHKRVDGKFELYRVRKK